MPSLMFAVSHKRHGKEYSRMYSLSTRTGCLHPIFASESHNVLFPMQVHVRLIELVHLANCFETVVALFCDVLPGLISGYLNRKALLTAYP